MRWLMYHVQRMVHGINLMSSRPGPRAPNFLVPICSPVPLPILPDPQVIGFDNFYQSFVSVFVVMTMEGWTEVMYKVQDAYSLWAFILFFFIIIIGSLVATNLFLCVITAQFSQVHLPCSS